MNSNRIYDPASSVVFHKTKAQFGGLSNMAAGYSVNINDIIIPTVEHLYQACRFPDNPNLQMTIISEASPMRAKWIAKANLSSSRSDWDNVRFKIMQWCLEVKLSQNWNTFGELLLSTGDLPIVEWAPKDKIWGAVETNGQLVGINALGRLLMFVREKYVKPNDYHRCIPPLNIPDFMLLGHSIDMVCNEDYLKEIEWNLREEVC